ncbi:MAG: magnesium transporter [Dehalococcoidia bacterium]
MQNLENALLVFLKERDIERAKELLGHATPEEIAAAAEALPAGDRQLLLQILDSDTAVAVFESLGAEARDAVGTSMEDPVVPDAGAVALLLSERQFETLRAMLLDRNPVDVARLLENLPPEQAVVTFRLLPKTIAVDVFEHMEGHHQERLLQSFTDDRARDLVRNMSPDDRTRLLEEVPAKVTHRLVQLLSPSERRATLTLLGYPESSAGRIMTPDFVDLRADMTVSQALERVRRLGMNKETIFYMYVTDSSRRLLGAVSLKDLVLASPETVVRNLMTPTPKAVATHTDQEEVAKILRDYDLLAVPVVDTEERLVGIVTHDDILDVIQEEATEDIYRYGAVPMTERAYFAANPFIRAWRRAPWLLFLLGVGFVTGTIIAGQEALLTQVAILAAFVPLLIGTGGNIGAQSSTVVIRGLATGEVTPRRALLTLGGEGVVGLMLAAWLGLLTVGLALVLTGGDARVAIVVGGTLGAIATVAAMVGGGLPFLFRLVRVDPAVASAPLVTTVMDVFGVVAYFLIANALLRV